MPIPSRKPFLLEFGRVDYEAGLRLQRRLVSLRQKSAVRDTLVLLEHPPVITLGRHADTRHLLASRAELDRRGAKLIRVERGGDITFHGPGQLVGYAVFRLRRGLVGVRRFVDLVQEALVSALRELGVNAGSMPGVVGVWVGRRKLASIGIAVRHGVTMHGFALNVLTDLDWFELMRPCGLEVRMTSVGLEGGKTENRQVRNAVVRGFEQAFGVRFQRNLPRSLTSLTKGLSASAISSA